MEHSIALVTGTTSGLGYAAASTLAAKGYRQVIVTGRSLARVQETAAQLAAETKNQVFTPLELDLDTPSSVQSALAELVKRGRPIDFLLLNAGLCATSGESCPTLARPSRPPRLRRSIQSFAAALDGRNEIGNEVGASPVNVLHPPPWRVDGLAKRHEGARGGADHHRDDDYDHADYDWHSVGRTLSHAVVYGLRRSTPPYVRRRRGVEASPK